MEIVLTDDIQKVASRLIIQDVEAIKKAVHGAKNLPNKEILLELKICIESKLNYLKSIDGFDM